MFKVGFLLKQYQQYRKMTVLYVKKKKKKSRFFPTLMIPGGWWLIFDVSFNDPMTGYILL